MPVNRKLSVSNGRMPPNSKSGKLYEALHESNSSLRRCKRKKLFLLWIFLGVLAVGSVWFFIGFQNESLTMMRKQKRWSHCEERARILLQRYNVSKKQLHALVSLFSVSDQVLCLCILISFLR